MTARADKDIHVPVYDASLMTAEECESWSRIADEASERAVKEIREIFSRPREKPHREKKGSAT